MFDVHDLATARSATFGMTLLGDRNHPALGRDSTRRVVPALRLVPGRLPSFVEDLIGIMIVGQDLHELKRLGVAARTIRSDADDVGIVAFDIDRNGKDRLISHGREAAEGFLRTGTGDDGRCGSGHFPLPGSHVDPEVFA